MRRLLLLAGLSVLPVAGAAHAAEPPARLLPVASTAGALAPDLTTAPDGTVWLSWLEPVDAGNHALKVARLDSSTPRWQPPREVARGPDWFLNWADTPRLAAADDGRLAAVWFVHAAPAADAEHAGGHGHGYGYGARVAFSADDGATWTEPAPLSRESALNEFVSLALLPDGRWLAVWLDGRNREHTGAMTLYGRVLGSNEPDTLIDDRVCDCCSTALVTFPDGSALVAYRDRSPEEVRDIAIAHWHGGAWTPGRPMHADGWKIAGCPVNGPALARRGAQVGAAWFTAANGAARVQVARSTEAGVLFGQPRRVDEPAQPSAPAGRVGSVLLPDGRLWASWLEGDGRLALRAMDGADRLGETLHLPVSAAGAARPAGIPRLAAVPGSEGGPPRLLVVRTVAPVRSPAAETTLESWLIDIPAPGTAEDDCGCGPGAATGRPTSYAVRATVLAVDREQGRLRIDYPAIAGFSAGGEVEVAVSPAVIAAVRPGQRLIGRLEPTADGSFRLNAVRLLGAAPAR